jgi:hypothetical protein
MIFRTLKNPYPPFLAGWKFLLSFRKRNWRLEDYPVLLRKLRDSSQSGGKTVRWTQPAYDAQIVNWHLLGTGETAAAALENLRERFNLACERLPSLPRPGTRVPIEFAAQERIAANSALADEFLHSVLDVEGAWVSDESSLWDFILEDSLDDCYAKIRALFGVDVSDIPGTNLAAILERIAHAREQQKLAANNGF